MTSPQMYIKVAGVWTAAHEENNRFRSINCSHGPGVNHWGGVDAKYATRLRELVLKHHSVDIYKSESTWLPDLAFLVQHEILDQQTHLRIQSWTMRPIEQGAQVDETINGSMAHTANSIIQELLQAKSAANYSNAALARVDALKSGYDEAIMLNNKGHIAEGSAENIFTVKNGKITTPPLEADILNGITRDSVIKIINASGKKVIQKNITIRNLMSADEIFMTGL